MWARYRKWKNWATPLVVVVALFLMKGEPDESPRWILGITLAAVLALLYIVEELIWHWLANGRPCKSCGKPIPIRTFRPALKCPACGKDFA